MEKKRSRLPLILVAFTLVAAVLIAAMVVIPKPATAPVEETIDAATLAK